ncbi:MAG: TIGR01777 family oxidoreductase [Ignavibacteriales bacterium]|nr:TIGR01777 family oxidoreductase [Ignavibacteriales bacterium]
MQKKVILTGATGLVGKYLFNELKIRGDEITVFVRNPAAAKKILPDAVAYIEWDYLKPINWEKIIDGKGAIIHLAGAAIGGRRWTKNIKAEIIESRIRSTQELVTAIGKVENRPEVLICASAIGYYGASDSNIFTEESPGGTDFLADVCKKWEEAAARVENFGIRRVNIRTGLVFGKNEGALAKMILPYQLFIGGPLGSGKQWISWIHIKDLVNIYLKCLDDENFSGPVNAVAPNFVTMKEFSRMIGEAIHRPAYLNIPEFVFKIFFGEASKLITTGQKVIPQKLLQNGYQFKYNNLNDALKNLLCK